MHWLKIIWNEFEPRTDLCDTILNNLLAGQVGLVADEQLVHTLRSIAVDFLQPLLHVGERIYKHASKEVGADDHETERTDHCQ